MLSDYKGPSNSPEMLQYLVGERIEGAFVDGAHLILMLSSGKSLILTAFGECVPAMYPESKEKTQKRVSKRKAEIERKQWELNLLTALPD